MSDPIIIPIIILTAFLIGCATENDDNIDENSQIDDSLQEGLDHLHDEMFDDNTDESIETACMYLPESDEYEELYNECVEYGAILPNSVEDIKITKEMLDYKSTKSACSGLFANYSLKNIKPLPSKYQDPLRGTFFSAKLTPAPECHDLFPRDYCSKKDDFDECRENAYSALDTLGDEMNGGEPIDYQNFCNNREEYSICGENPHESAVDISEDYDNICANSPNFNVIGFASIGNKNNHDINLSIEPMQSPKLSILSIVPEETECSFENEIQNIEPTDEQLPCSSNHLGALLFYDDIRMTPIIAEEQRPLNEYPFVFNSFSIDWKQWDTVEELLNINEVPPNTLFSLESPNESSRDQRDLTWNMSYSIYGRFDGEFITFDSDLFTCGEDEEY